MKSPDVGLQIHRSSLKHAPVSYPNSHRLNKLTTSHRNALRPFRLAPHEPRLEPLLDVTVNPWHGRTIQEACAANPVDNGPWLETAFATRKVLLSLFYRLPSILFLSRTASCSGPTPKFLRIPTTEAKVRAFGQRGDFVCAVAEFVRRRGGRTIRWATGGCSRRAAAVLFIEGDFAVSTENFVAHRARVSDDYFHIHHC